MLKPASAAKLVAAACLALSLAAGNALVIDLKEGKEYAVLPQTQPTDAKGKIEVTEFFWYGCPHCYEFEPTLNAWLKTLPKDVAFRRVPADFGRWTGGAKLFYALEALGEEDRVHKDLFDAVHRDRLDFNNQAAVGEWLAKKGIDRKKFDEAYNSFSVQSNVSRAQHLTRTHALTGVPAVIVGGKYVTNNVMAGGFEQLPAVMNELIARLRPSAAPAAAKPEAAAKAAAPKKTKKPAKQAATSAEQH